MDDVGGRCVGMTGDGRTDRASLQDDVGGRRVGMTGTDAQIVRPYRTTWVDDVWESLFPDTVPYRYVVGLNYCNEPALICRTTISVPLDSEHSTKWGRL